MKLILRMTHFNANDIAPIFVNFYTLLIYYYSIVLVVVELIL